MKSLWNDQEADTFQDDLGLRVYTSRLLGADKRLVLHGGGNTSVKIRQQDIFGQDQDILYVKGSGWDLETIDRPGFAPVRLDHLIKLAQLETLSDTEMVNELKTHMLDASAPAPSIEAILHAVLPYRFVDHTHADAVVTVTNTPHGLDYIREIYGDTVVVIPYVMPGFELARLCGQLYQAQSNDNTVGMVLMNHGIFSFADTARESYERMIQLVSQAEDFLDQKGAWDVIGTESVAGSTNTMLDQARLRKRVSESAGRAMILSSSKDPVALSFIRRPDVAQISQQGPVTPDHIIRTKRVPMLDRDLDAYVDQYKHYFESHEPHSKDRKTMLDPAPRIILDSELGLCTVGKTANEAKIVEEIYRHTMEIIARSTALERFTALGQQDLFEVEYWELEQAKLRGPGKLPEFTGEVALVTGAASGIGKACVNSFLKRGAAVVGLDIDPKVTQQHSNVQYCGIHCDVADVRQIQLALQQAVQAFGGLDMVVLNAGIFPASMNIDQMDLAVWDKTMGVNLKANLIIMKAAHELLKLAPQGGRVVIIGSKNVAAPGPGAAAYSASKAALNQLMRVAALEWGGDEIRINTLHPNAVFDTGLWTDEVLHSRAKSYGLSVEEYKRRNVMKVEVCSHDVAELAAEMCGSLFAKTTAAQVPVDGGDQRVV